MMKKLLFGTLFATMAFGPNIALAEWWPANVLGSWSFTAIEATGTLTIVSQNGIGDCQSIFGNLNLSPTAGFSSPISGFYCTRSGRIHFLVNSVDAGKTAQAFTGNATNLSPSGLTLQMDGVFAQDFGPFGEYPFSASQQIIISPLSKSTARSIQK